MGPRRAPISVCAAALGLRRNTRVGLSFSIVNSWDGSVAAQTGVVGDRCAGLANLRRGFPPARIVGDLFLPLIPRRERQVDADIGVKVGPAAPGQVPRVVDHHQRGRGSTGWRDHAVIDPDTNLACRRSEKPVRALPVRWCASVGALPRLAMATARCRTRTRAGRARRSNRERERRQVLRPKHWSVHCRSDTNRRRPPAAARRPLARDGPSGREARPRSSIAGFGSAKRAAPDGQFRVLSSDGGHELVREYGVELKLETLNRHDGRRKSSAARPADDRPGAHRSQT